MNIRTVGTYNHRPTLSACKTDSTVCGDAGRYPWCPIEVLEAVPPGENRTLYGKMHALRCEGVRPEEGRA